MINIEISPTLPVKSPRRKRSLVGAAHHRFVNWLTNTSYQKINLDLDTSLVPLITRARELAKNNMVVRSYLELMEKNIIGKAGFTLQSQVKGQNGKLDTSLNDYLEWEFYDWMKTTNGYLTIDGGLGGKELDKLILRTLLIDGEVFIRIHKNAKNPYRSFI
jgi:capsid protein